MLPWGRCGCCRAGAAARSPCLDRNGRGQWSPHDAAAAQPSITTRQCAFNCTFDVKAARGSAVAVRVARGLLSGAGGRFPPQEPFAPRLHFDDGSLQDCSVLFSRGFLSAAFSTADVSCADWLWHWQYELRSICPSVYPAKQQALQGHRVKTCQAASIFSSHPALLQTRSCPEVPQRPNGHKHWNSKTASPSVALPRCP